MLFSSPDLEFTNYLYVTGFLFFDGNGLADWQPSQQARVFVENGERVLVLALGCLPGPGASSVACLAAGAAVRLKRKLVIQPGWSALDVQAMQGTLDSGYVCLAGPLPHDWLFARADAVMHFGGAGLCARTIRCGVPSLVLPQRADQFFNARCLLELGAGAAMSPTQLTEERLRRILAEKVMSTACRDAANKLSIEIGKEAGAQVACRQIESLL